MQQIRTIMGMPVTIEIVGDNIPIAIFEKIFSYFRHIDETFSLYKLTSEITKINHGIIQEKDYSEEMKEVFRLCEETKRLSHGYFDIRTSGGILDTSGLVKGWSIHKASKILESAGYHDFTINVGSDIQTSGRNEHGEKWKIGIRNPFKSEKEVIKIVHLSGKGIATSGNQLCGKHIYNPNAHNAGVDDIASITVIGPNVYEADRFATPAFAMGKEGVYFIDSLEGFEAYSIDKNGVATETRGFEKYTKE